MTDKETVDGLRRLRDEFKGDPIVCSCFDGGQGKKGCVCDMGARRRANDDKFNAIIQSL